MFQSTILDVVVGLIFSFLAVSMAASAAVEALATVLKWRAATLLEGVKQILNDDDFTKLAKTLYDHALISPRETPDTKPGDMARKPAYIDPRQFAAALMQTIDLVKATPEQAKADVNANALLDDQLKTFLVGVIDRGSGDALKMQKEIADWFDNAMDRLSGAYKRKAQLYNFLIALAMTVALNVNSLRLASDLWLHPSLTKNLAVGQDFPSTLAALPVGWTQARWDELWSGLTCGLTVLGWLITAFATLFGAPFWFDALQSIIRLKGTGPSPAEKKDGSAASA